MKKLFILLIAILLVAGMSTTTAFANEADSVQGYVQSAGGAPIEGAEVALIDVDAGAIMAVVETDAYGAFAFSGGAEGNYMLAIVASGFEPATVPVADADLYVELVPTFSAFGARFAPTGAPTGLLMVFVMDPDFAVVPNATATFNGATLTENYTLFQMNVVPGQAGTLVVNAPGFQTYTRAITATDFLGSFAMINVIMEPSIFVFTQVLCDWSSLPIEGATVTLNPIVQPPVAMPPLPPIQGPATTGANGEYRFFNVPAGAFFLVAEADGFVTGNTWPQTVLVPGSGGNLELTIRLTPVITVEVLCAATDAVIPNANVVLWHNSSAGFVDVASGVTGINGSVNLIGPAPGAYFATAEADGFYANTSQLQILYSHGTLTVRLDNTPPPPDGTIGPGGAPWWFNNGTIIVGAGEICDVERPWGGVNPWWICGLYREITRIVFVGDITAGLSLQRLFAGFPNLTTIEGLERLDTSNVVDMSHMFLGSNGLTNLDLSSLDTSNVTSMIGMFAHMDNLTSLNLSNWDTSNVIYMWSMFQYARSLTSLDLTNFDTINVTSTSSMFFRTHSLTSLDLSGWDMRNVTHMTGMFSGASSLTSLDLSGWDTHNVINMNYMFANTLWLRQLTLGNTFDFIPPTGLQNPHPGWAWLGYTGYWKNIDTGKTTPCLETHPNPAGTWIWQLR